MAVRRVWFVTLGAIGSGALAYVFVVRGFLEPSDVPAAGLGWPIIGVLPLFVFGMWLLTATSSHVALYVALAGTGAAVGSAYETLVRANPELMEWAGFPYLNAVGLTADGVATAGFLLMLGAFPDGVLERRWQRVALSSVWICVLVAPLTLLTMPTVVLPSYLGMTAAIENPWPSRPLPGRRRSSTVLVVSPWFFGALTVLVLLSRAFTGPERTRARVRVMAWTVIFFGTTFVLWTCPRPLASRGLRSAS